MFLPHCQTIIKHTGYYIFFVYLQSLRKDGRVAEGAGLENRYTLHGVSGVRIPLLPQRIQNSIAAQTAVLFHFLPPPSPLPLSSLLFSYPHQILIPGVSSHSHRATFLTPLFSFSPSSPLSLHLSLPTSNSYTVADGPKSGTSVAKGPKMSQVVQRVGHL